jgi:hypothetical protein
MTPLLHAGVTPAGKFEGAPIPVAPVVVIVIGVSAVFAHSVGLALGEPAVLEGDTTIGAVLFSV